MSELDFIKDDFLIEMFKPLKEWLYLINLIDLGQPFMIIKNEWLEDRKDENVIFSGTKLDVSFATLFKLNLYIIVTILRNAPRFSNAVPKPVMLAAYEICNNRQAKPPYMLGLIVYVIT